MSASIFGPLSAVQKAAARWKAMAGETSQPAPRQPALQPGQSFAEALMHTIKAAQAAPGQIAQQFHSGTQQQAFRQQLGHPTANPFAMSFGGKTANPFGGSHFGSSNPFAGSFSAPNAGKSIWDYQRFDGMNKDGSDPNAVGGGMTGVGNGVDQWSEQINRVSQETGIPWQVLASIMSIESQGSNLSANGAGAVGLMQVVPQYWQDTANKYGGNLSDPYTNIRTAADILMQNYKQYGSWENAAAAYFGGGGAFDSNGGYTNASDGNTDINGYVSSFRNYMNQYGYGQPSAAEHMSGGAAASDWASQAVNFAMQAQGTPYVWGGHSPGGFDCSGLVQWAYGMSGKDVGWTAAEQYDKSQRIDGSQLQSGDLVFFTDGNRVSHVAIYVGNGQILDAPSEGKTVRIISLSTDWYQQHLYGFGRVA